MSRAGLIIGACAGAALLGVAVFGGAGAANAVVVEPYTIVAWNVSDPMDVWAVPQTYHASLGITVPDLTALDSTLECGSAYQIDIYNSGPITDALIAGGVLVGPNNPQEDLIPGGDNVAYHVINTAACVVPPVVVPPVVTPPVDVPVSTEPELAYTATEINPMAPISAGLTVLLGGLMFIWGRLQGFGLHRA